MLQEYYGNLVINDGAYKSQPNGILENAERYKKQIGIKVVTYA